MTKETHTKIRTVRIDDELWAAFTQAADDAGIERATLLRAFIAWYARQPGAKLPKRP